MRSNNEIYWRRKLSAYLHDSPDKVISLLDHEGRAQSLAQPAGLRASEQARKESDHAASAADRLPWPKSSLGDQLLCRSEFDATDCALIHPLGDATIRFDKNFPSALAGLETSHRTLPKIAVDNPRAAFITVWRFWQNWASSVDERFACLPAETRLPDHTIWNHLSVTSALQGCCGGSQEDWDPVLHRPKRPLPDRPAFLLFTIGPVQDFIAAARNTRDLWSGSYLLSYLIGTALARIALDFGPDHVVFPNLLNQPILDLLLKRDLWDSTKTADGKDLWRAFGYYDEDGKRRLLTPSLPNRFLAVLPSTMVEHSEWREADAQGRKGAVHYAAELAGVVQRGFGEIAESVAEKCAADIGASFDRGRFLRQVKRLLEVHWQVLDWPGDVEAILKQAKQVPGEESKHPADALEAVREMVRRMPVKHRDPRYFTGEDVGGQDQPGQLKQPAAGWAALFGVTSWQLDAVKATRSFEAWSQGGWEVGEPQNKDSLTGKEEACVSVSSDKDEAKRLSQELAKSPHAVKPGDRLGAATLIKRLWHRTWLSKQHPFDPDHPYFFAMPNTRSIAAHEPWVDNADDEAGGEDEGKYFAVLALDGDEMGKWISGVKCPPIARQLSKEAQQYFHDHHNAEFLKVRRPLSPSFHLQFSELLGNFSLHCVRRIVEAFDGRLIYAGGDDVLAMLPADTALECARALRAAFRGEKSLAEIAKGIINRRGRREDWKSDRSTYLFSVEQPGFLKLTAEAAPEGHGAAAGLLSEPVTFPFLVPGPASDCSVGIAIAHFKSPLQDTVRAAQAAEKRAKKQLDRSAVAVTLFKRSGETIEWGCKWDGGGLGLYHAITDALEAEQLSSKFPYRFAELLGAYLTETTPLVKTAKTVRPVQDFKVDEVVRREFDHTLSRQHGARFPNDENARTQLLDNLSDALGCYLNNLAGKSAEEQLQALIGLCQTVAFAHRTRDDGSPSVPSASSMVQTSKAERQTV